MPRREELDRARRQTRAVYERQAAGYDRHRVRVFYEKACLDRLIDRLPPGGHVLDLGCGTGEPIDRYLLEQGFAVTGLDFSGPMLAIARDRLPEATFIQQDMRALKLAGQRFDAVLSWDGFFHLTAGEQVALLDQLPQVLKQPGELFLTVGPEAGEVIGHVEGEAVYHASLAPEAYEAQLTELGFRDARVYASETELEERVLLTARFG